jgi:hypothetical protein
VPSDREHEFLQGGKSTSYEDVCLVTANSGVAGHGGDKIQLPARQRAIALKAEVTGPAPIGEVLMILSTAIDGETKLWRAGYAMGQRIKLLPGIVFLGHFINQK